MRPFRLLLALMLLVPIGASQATRTSPPEGEALRYLVSYRGIFSAMAWVDIADAVLRERQLDEAAEPLRELALFVTSEPHDFVESVYPFRYRARSLYVPAQPGSLAFERYKETSKRKHDLFWLDRDQGHVMRFRPDGQQPDRAELPPRLTALLDPQRQMRCEGLGAALDQSPVFDRLGLLRRLRTLDLRQRTHRVPVTDGKRRLTYRITREAEETVEAAGRRWPAWKLRVEQMVQHGSDDEPHRPVYVWLSRGAERLPLLFENSHAIGRFAVRLADADFSEFADTPFTPRRREKQKAEFVARRAAGEIGKHPGLE